MRKILFVLLMTTFGLSASLYAQSENQEVIVFLKNGQKISGKLQLSIYDDHISLAHDSLSQTYLSFQSIKKIHFGNVPADEPATYFTHQRGIFHLANLGLQIGDNSNGATTTFTIHTVNGYVFSPHLMVGVGIGLDHYDGIRALPLYASIQGIITDRKVSPFYFANVGGSWAWPGNRGSGITYERTEGGLFAHGGLGYQINLARSALLFSGGYKIQQSDFAYNFEGWQSETFIEEKRLLRRATVTIGFTF